MTRLQLAATAAAAGLLIAIIFGHGRRDSRPSTAPAIVEQPATPQPARAGHLPSVLRPATRAIRWQLAAETGLRQTPPAHTFTAELEQQLMRWPPRPAPAGTRVHVLGVRETQPIPSARRVLVTVRRGDARSQVTLLLLCRRQCLVASIE